MKMFPFAFVMFGIGATYMVLVVCNMVLLGRLRKEGRIPPKPISTQLDMITGKYDKDVPEIARVRKIAFSLMGLFFVAGIAGMILTVVFR